MTYDSSISSDISLSKILDCFIVENDDYDFIVSFLKQHDSDFKDIFKYSLHCIKMFQLDFFLACNEDSQKYIIRKLRDIPIFDAALFTWQILKSNSLKVQKVKYEFRKELKWIMQYGPRHPYSFKHESYIAPLDNACFKLAENDSLSSIADLVPYEKLCKYFKYMNYSLFQNRLMQYDIFSKLNDISKFVFIRDAFPAMNIHTVRKLAMQILDSDEEFDVKALCLNGLLSTTSDTVNVYYNANVISEECIKIVDECKSFSEMMLKMSIFNSDISQNLVLYLMIYKPNWILEWIEYDEKELNSILNVSEFAKKWLISKKKR